MQPKPVPFQAEGPRPLVRQIPKGEPFPVDALGPLKAAVMEVQAVTEAPVAIPAQSALSVAALAVQALADVETLGGAYCPTSLYFLTIASSGERKSSCDKFFMRAIRQFERDAEKSYRGEYSRWETAVKVHKATADALVKKIAKGGDGVVAAQADLEALGPEPQAPQSPLIISSEPTFEGLVKHLMRSVPSVGVFSDEGGAFVGGHAMSEDHRLKTAAGLSQLWGGDPINRTRAGDGCFTIRGKRLSLHLMAQPIAAQQLLSDEVVSGQGLLARILICQPESHIGSRLKDVGACRNVAQVAAFNDRIRQILDTPKVVSEDDPGELLPRKLPLSAEARALLFEFYKAVETEQGKGKALASVTPWASKSAEQAARIAGVLTLYADLNASEVGVATMADAITLASFYLGEAKRLTEAASVSVETTRAEQLRRWLLDVWPGLADVAGMPPDAITVRDVVRLGPGGLRETKKVKPLIKILVDHGWLEALPPNSEVGGVSRREAFKVVRAEP